MQKDSDKFGWLWPFGRQKPTAEQRAAEQRANRRRENIEAFVRVLPYLILLASLVQGLRGTGGLSGTASWEQPMRFFTRLLGSVGGNRGRRLASQLAKRRNEAW